MTDRSLPYAFDLWFDIKTREELVRHYSETKHELERIERVMEDHGMKFTPDEMAVISPQEDPENSLATGNSL